MARPSFEVRSHPGDRNANAGGCRPRILKKPSEPAPAPPLLAVPFLIIWDGHALAASRAWLQALVLIPFVFASLKFGWLATPARLTTVSLLLSIAVLVMAGFDRRPFARARRRLERIEAYDRPALPPRQQLPCDFGAGLGILGMPGHHCKRRSPEIEWHCEHMMGGINA